MITPEMVAAIAAFVTALGGIVWTGYTSRRQSKTDDAMTKIQSATVVIDGYDDLCKTLRAEIDRLQQHVRDNDAQIISLNARVTELKAALQRSEAEKVDLVNEVERQRAKIICLEKDNESLRAEIAELRQQQGGRYHATETE